MAESVAASSLVSAFARTISGADCTAPERVGAASTIETFRLQVALLSNGRRGRVDWLSSCSRRILRQEADSKSWSQ